MNAIDARTERIIGAIVPHASNGALVSIGVIGGTCIGAGLFVFGYRIGYATGVLQPWIDVRGWIVLLFIALGLPILFIYYGNKKANDQ